MSLPIAPGKSFRCWKWIGLTTLPLYIFLATSFARAQTDQDTRSADHSLPDVKSAGVETTKLPVNGVEPQPALPELPAQVEIPANQHIPVVLDTLLSTRISKIGDAVTFRTPYSILLGDGLEVPPYIEILGHVMKVQRPGHFEKQGVLGVAIDRLRLGPGESTDLKAHLDSKEIKAQGRPVDDRRHPNEVRSVPIYGGVGALTGSAIGGAKGAGIGAGAGVAIALLIMASHRGDDVYLEPGEAFSLILDQPVYLNGNAVYAAQQNYMKNRRSPIPDDPRSAGQENGTPKLKRRPPLPSN